MIEEYTGKDIPPADLCVIGSGAAGLELAHSLRDCPLSIIVLEGGYLAFDWRTQRLNDFRQGGRPIRSPDYSRRFALEEARTSQCRLRQYGGTTNIWSGRWKVLGPADLEPKPSVGEAGWPISYRDLQPYYRAVAADYGVSDLLRLNRHGGALPMSLSSAPGMSPSVCLIEDSPTNVGQKRRWAIECASNVRLVVGANVVRILLRHGLRRVDRVVVRTLGGREWTVGARWFVIACGAIENARILLNSNTQLHEGVGNENNWLGRNFMDHPKGVGGVFVTAARRRVFPEAGQFRAGEVGFGIGLTMQDARLREWNLPNHCMHIKKGKEPGQYLLKFYLEQLPNPESRVTVSPERDILGVPLAHVDWRFRQQDYSCFRGFVERARSLLGSHGELFVEESHFDMRFLGDASHQMGTTRMARRPEDGVVDGDCRVFGIDNLFLAGSSVFPAGGSANPIFTILALTRRLGDHLRRIIEPHHLPQVGGGAAFWSIPRASPVDQDGALGLHVLSDVRRSSRVVGGVRHGSAADRPSARSNLRGAV